MKFVVEAIGAKAGGGHEVAANLIPGLAQAGRHEVVAVVSALAGSEAVARNCARVVQFPGDAGLLRRHFILNRAVPRLCREENADVLLCLGNFAPAASPCPVVVFLQNAWFLCDEPGARRRLTLRERLIVRYGKRRLERLPASTHFVVQTAVMRRRLASLRGASQNGITVIPSVPELLGPAPRAAPAAPKREAFTFLCLSRYAAHKNLEILVDAAKRLREAGTRPFRCLLTTAAGEHPGARKLLGRIEREGLGGVIGNLGPVARESLAETYRAADAHLLPTLLETAGLTYDEAMHFGLPILTSDRDFAREHCLAAALYFDPLDPASVANAMRRVMEDGELRARLIENGWRIARKRPAWDRISAQFARVLERVAAGLAPGEREPRCEPAGLPAGAHPAEEAS